MAGSELWESLKRLDEGHYLCYSLSDAIGFFFAADRRHTINEAQFVFTKSA